ncbi:hypothetical protein L602_000900001170 [Cupriavidus gilardii J11]|uniref:Uncharacterized protein n=1 Tax=Cupriavidus gilardii J11 TaxID=936133 RepID=A0A562B137_9BURK|nr:hypothetical protein [Cupriavidus gilardii]TWG78813.1 hypothetical protein L602_000900001170 [Cupriavidus gilardii J11]
MNSLRLTRKPLSRTLYIGAAVLVAAAGCAPTQPTPPPQVTPLNATIKLGRIADKRFVSRVDVEQARAYPGYGVGVGAASGGGWGGGGVGVGFAVDLTRLLNRQPTQQVDIYEYRVNALDGTTITANGPAAPGLDPGACVRVIYSDGGREPGITPSNEC